MSVVVTGATGPFGRHVVESLIVAGFPADQIVAGGRRTEVLATLPDDVRVVTIDYDRPETLSAALAGADTVMLVSGSEVGQRVRQHRNVIDAAKAAGARRVVYTSAPHADTSDLVMAPEHKATEEALHDSGLVWTVLRNNWYTDGYAATLRLAQASGELVASAGDGRVASAPRTDYAEAAAVVLRTEGHDGVTYELSGDVAWHHDDLAAAITEITGRSVVYRPVSPEEHLRILMAGGMDEASARFVVALDANIRDGALADATDQLSGLLGRPTTPLVDALRAAATLGGAQLAD